MATANPRRSSPGLRLDDGQVEQLVTVGRDAGLDHVGSCPARPWTSTRSVLEDRREAGLNHDMAFTYKNPARSSDPTRALRHAATMLVAARSYAQDIPEDPPPGLIAPVQIARYATADHYGRLRSGLEAMADHLRHWGARSVVHADSNAVVDREAAWRSGLGWYGKNSLLLSPGAGSWFVIGSLITDAVIPRIADPVPDGCGTCTRCIDGCPTGAIVAPGVVDAAKCLSWLLQATGPFPEHLRSSLGDRIYGCDDCQEVCPPNRTVELRSRRSGPWPTECEPGRWVDACELLDLDDDQLLERCSRWYIRNRDPVIVRRNLLIVLGNSAQPDNPEVQRRLRYYASGSDPLLAEHAEWALAALASALAEPVRSGETQPS